MRFQGMGIGLYISNEIIKRHQGKMWLESEPGKGSTVYFSIPTKSGIDGETKLITLLNNNDYLSNKQ